MYFFMQWHKRNKESSRNTENGCEKEVKNYPYTPKVLNRKRVGEIIQHEAHVHSPYLRFHTHHLLSFPPPSSFLLLREIL